MTPGMKMMMMSRMRNDSGSRSGGSGGRNETEMAGGRQDYGTSERSGYGDTRGNYSGSNNRSNYSRSENEMGDMEARFRGRERFDYSDYGEQMNYPMREMESRRRFPRRKDGTFAPRSEMEDMEEMESRRQRDRRGRFTSEDDMDEPGMNYPYTPYISPIYEREKRGGRMNLIGFERQDEAHNNYGMRAEHHQMNEMEHRSSPHAMGGVKSELKMTKEMAEEWMMGLQNEDGTKGPHWSMDQAKQVMQQRGIQSDLVTFWAVLNMMYSDYCKIFKKHGVGDRVDFYADMASAWINDKDADRQKKTAAYYQYVVNQ